MQEYDPVNKSEIKWSPRVSRDKLKRLYESYTSGMVNDKLLDDVGITIYLRCCDIITVYEARKGFVKCPGCSESGRDTVIKRNFMARELPAGSDELMECPICGWNATWRNYTKSYKRKQLNSGGALDSFKAYVHAYPLALTSDKKMMLIDRLIHEFHYSLKSDPGLPTRSVGPNLINATLTEVMVFLNELTYGTDDNELYDENHSEWLKNAEKWEEWLESFNAGDED